MKRIVPFLSIAFVFVLCAFPVFASDGADAAPAVPAGTVSSYEGDDNDAVSASSLADAVRTVFGEYNPRTHTVTTYLTDGTAVTAEEVIPGLAGLDYVWLASVLLFALSLYCIFRMIGGLLRWK